MNWLAAAMLAVFGGAQSDFFARAGTKPITTDRKVDASRFVVYGTQWHAPIVKSGFEREVSFSFGMPGIAVDEGLLIVGTGEGELRGYRLATGELVWVVDRRIPFLGPVSVIRGDNRFAVTSGADGMLIAFDIRTGSFLWESQLDGQSLAEVVHAGDRLVVTTVENKVSAVALDDGERLWTAGRPKSTELTIHGHGAASVDDGLVFAGFSDGTVEAYALQNGALLWSRSLAREQGGFVDCDADPVVANGRVFMSSYGAGIFALDRNDGRTLWNHEARSVTGIAVYDKLVLAGSADGHLWGLSQNDGQLRYHVGLPRGKASRIRISGDLALFTSGDSGLVVVRAATGQPLQATPLLGLPAGAPEVDGEFAAAISSRGFVYVMRRGSPGLVSSRSNWPGI